MRYVYITHSGLVYKTWRVRDRKTQMIGKIRQKRSGDTSLVGDWDTFREEVMFKPQRCLGYKTERGLKSSF